MCSRSYIYTDDLLGLEARRCDANTTPLIVHNWSQALRNHPDRQFVAYILNGLAPGFHIGVDPNHRCTSCKDNMRSGYKHSQPVDDYIVVESLARLTHTK